VTLRGDEVVVVIAAADLQRLLSPASAAVPFVTCMESLNVNGLDLSRGGDRGRDTAL
jgi:hypothetical protein